LQAYILKERLEARKKIDEVATNINGGVNDAAMNLTMFTKDTVDEVI